MVCQDKTFRTTFDNYCLLQNILQYSITAWIAINATEKLQVMSIPLVKYSVLGWPEDNLKDMIKFVLLTLSIGKKDILRNMYT